MNKIVSVLLRLYPRAFRDSHGAEILEFIRSECLRSRSLGRGFFWVRTCADLAAGAVRIRLGVPSPVERAPRRRRDTDLGKDFVLGLRSLAATPLVSGILVLTLGLGIGMNAAIFSVVHAVLLEPLAYHDPDRLTLIKARWTADDVDDANHTGMDFKRLRDGSRTFDDIAAVRNIRQNLTGPDVPLQVEVGWASRNLFRLLGVSPMLGAGFTEDAPPGTLVLSHHLWLDAFGGEDDVVGRAVRLDEHPYTVAGVLPRGFTLSLPRFPSRVDVWKVPDDWWQNGDLWSGDNVDFALLDLIGRLDSGRTIVEAQGEMEGFAKQFREQRPDFARAGGEYEVVPLLDALVGDVSPYLYMLLGAVGLVLLVACANVMNLLLARAQAREPEIALRLALGSSRLRVVRLLLAESSIIALAGGSLGLGLAALLTLLLKALRPAELPRLDEVALDPVVLGFALLVSVGSTLLFGVLPAVVSTRRLRASDIRGARVHGGRRQHTGRLLVAAQISVSLVLWIGAALLTTSLIRLAEVNPGFEHENLLTFSVSLPGTKYERPEGTDRFFRELEERIESLPGAESAGVAWPLPLSHRSWSNTYTAGAVREGSRAYANYRVTTPDFFETMVIRLLHGRMFSPADARHVAIVNRTLAERAWGGDSANALGRTILANPWGGGAEEYEVIGVVGDVRYSNLREPPSDTIYFDSRGWSWTDWEMDFVVRAGGVAPEALVGPIRELMTSMDPAIPMSRPRPMSGYLDDYLAANRFAMMLIGLFATVAGVLATVGLYGVVSYSVTRRAREIGIRMAVGAAQTRILSWVYRDSMALVALGIGTGLIAARALSRYVGSLLFAVETTDGLTFVAAAGMLTAVSVIACYAPARRAARLDPMRVLRSE